MDDNWIMVYSARHQYDAELVKQLLEENDITAVVINKQDSVYLIGDIEVYVQVEDAFTARQIIIKNKGE
jgi:hypothetical protein